MQYLSFCGKI